VSDDVFRRRVLDRRRFIGGAAAAFAAAATAPARAATSVTTQLQWIKDVQNAGWWIADDRGYFRNAGIDSVTLAGGPNVPNVEAIVAAGRADVGVDLLERIVDANSHGEDFVVFGALYQHDPGALMSLPKNPVRTAHDILGKRLGLQQGGHLYVDAIMRINHLPPAYTEVDVGFDPEPLVEGACDAFLSFVTSEPLVLAARHVPTVIAMFDALGYETYTDALFCTREYLTKNRDTLVRYARALQRGWAANARDPRLGARLAVSAYGAALGLEEPEQLAVNRAQIPLMASAATQVHGPLWVDVARISGPIYRTYRATGRTNLPPVSRLVDTSILTAASGLQ
jgi:ABC-type nitrate/sulfonate/bicarbonate transport system substrate-binding protein